MNQNLSLSETLILHNLRDQVYHPSLLVKYAHKWLTLGKFEFIRAVDLQGYILDFP